MIVLSTYKKCLVFSYYILLLWVLKYYTLTCQANNFKKAWSSKEGRNNIIYLFNNYKRKSFIYDYSNTNGKARTLYLFVHPRNYLINKKNEIETHNVPLVTRRGTYINYYSSTKKGMFSLLFVFLLRRKYDGKEKKLYHKRLGIRKIRLNEKKKDNIYDNNHQSEHSITNNNIPKDREKGESEQNTPKHKKEEEINQGNRQFLTDTKYYKRSKYSKAGYIKEKDHNNNVIEKHEEEKKKKKGLDIFDDFINDRYNIYYTENKEDLVEKMNEKKKKENKMSLPDFFILNYYLDKNRKNNLDLMINVGDNDLIKGGSAITGSFSSTMKNMLQYNVLQGKAYCNNGNIDSESNNSINNINDSKNNSSDGSISSSSSSCSDYSNYKNSQSYSKHTEFINNYNVIGQIIGVRGLLGCLKVVSFTTFNDIRFEPGSYRYIFMNNYNYPLPIKILDVKESQKVSFLYIKIEGINTRSDALKLKNCLICDDKRTFPDLGENQYISTDLLNFDIHIFNDFSNISIGNVNGFLSKYDYIYSKSVQQISDDLIKIHLKKNISLEKVFNIINVAKLYNQNKNNSINVQDTQNNNPIKNIQAIKVLINKSNTYNTHEEDIQENNIPSEPIKNDKNYYDSLDNFDGYSYKKIFKCDYCDHIFDDIKEASIHENSHFSSDEELLYNRTKIDDSDKQKVYEVTKDQARKLKNVEYFLVPIVKEKTIRSVHYEDKKIYLDISTIFLIDDNK
ncbi:mitochondrial preribosomal assembly protein rimM precursor, putative [Plasmodium reichenowi]|uniref:Mitochondrial preribosomal assembly protein rimM, putative n=1 Tax=Plasmodium reichenowi TaxID=5854 RepID=A0A060RTH8_PLARE|nr:mitochondrial preribosomal assembly protein rimM precursor, putative [Plasmodium reichenowi]